MGIKAGGKLEEKMVGTICVFKNFLHHLSTSGISIRRGHYGRKGSLSEQDKRGIEKTNHKHHDNERALFDCVITDCLQGIT
jgi:hypothetical protein